ncbi:MAG TPA: alternative ribosome rescue aminoacyl-tRNA hydrolase ArfB [Anaerolineaceae bacterium]|jgi:ribosome-associated protein|nr:aminoacyl-tRNA hydrolase [Chloroflexota bacterium]HNS07318.1 alternative ribosome rescue aminoacyl-tRNA hydrolase ArfB [Anaerolineaceae bacterium]HNW13678.1 alternative ribosome rescue aminoacyl-tRNA hydrolase ArfB [Anaerolineaceae bacterium]HOE01577.1 alternative ribosome rescue aminoacyl-tRNA hydrolase ArfB [Anaerolineaceae bacterium]HOQ68727.1 alternative ribosome rescue aminoacyl-tRNA hydrolase ArfB [Anaerolineaceae bacterium]
MKQIPENEISIRYVHSSGPGGQHVNKVATTAQLRFDIKNSLVLSEHVKERLFRLAGRRVTGDGVLVIEAGRFRERERNRQEAINRLFRLVEQAQQTPQNRIPTRPRASDITKRLEAKKRRALIKFLRHFRPEREE